MPNSIGQGFGKLSKSTAFSNHQPSSSTSSIILFNQQCLLPAPPIFYAAGSGISTSSSSRSSSSSSNDAGGGNVSWIVSLDFILIAFKNTHKQLRGARFVVVQCVEWIRGAFVTQIAPQNAQKGFVVSRR